MFLLDQLMLLKAIFECDLSSSVSHITSVMLRVDSDSEVAELKSSLSLVIFHHNEARRFGSEFSLDNSELLLHCGSFQDRLVILTDSYHTILVFFAHVEVGLKLEFATWMLLSDVIDGTIGIVIMALDIAGSSFEQATAIVWFFPSFIAVREFSFSAEN